LFDCRALAKMNSVSTIEVPEMCQSLVGLVKRQQKICRRNIEVGGVVPYRLCFIDLYCFIHVLENVCFVINFHNLISKLKTEA